MIIDIPAKNAIKLSNDGDLLGSLASTFGIDFEKNKGKFSVSDRVVKTSSSDVSSTIQGLPVSFAIRTGTVGGVSKQRLWAIGGGKIYQTPLDDIFATFTEDDLSGRPTDIDDKYSDMKKYNSALYVTSGTGKIYKRTSTAWSTVTSALVSGQINLLEGYTDRVYVTAAGTSIHSLNTSDVLATTGSYTLSLPNTITCLKAGTNGIWIGTSQSFVSGISSGCSIYFWDGVTENEATRYEINAQSILSLCILNNRPYAIDNMGRILTFNGSYFQEVDRFPFEFIKMKDATSLETNIRPVHPNGMVVINDKINILVNNKRLDSTDLRPKKLWSGIWELDEEKGLYHKHAISISTTSSKVDVGQVDLVEVGALFPIITNSTSKDDFSSFVCGVKYSANTSTDRYGIFMHYPIADTLKRHAFFYTTQIQSPEIQDTWQKLVLAFKPLSNSTDKIVVKYRTQEYQQYEANITWVNTTSFTSTDSDFATIKTGFEAGNDYEVFVVLGDGAGSLAHISNITENAGTYTITLDETITGMTTNTAKVVVERWNKIDSFSDALATETFKEFPVGEDATWIQYKVYVVADMNSGVLERVVSVSKTNQPFQ